MRHLNQKMLHGWIAAVSIGRTIKFAIVALGMAGFLSVLAPSAKAITQLEFLQWMVQLSGDNAQFSATSSSADYAQWARNKGMNPTGGWLPTAVLTPEQLAQALVQLYGLNPHKFGGNYFRILEREGIVVSQGAAEVSRAALAGLIDEFGFQNRQAVIARSHTSEKGNNGIGNGEDPPPPGWQNPRNPHFGQPQNDEGGVGNHGHHGNH
ncbi:MAG: hypothetical protein QOF48_1685 [Verrucomicrobiota bacterium]|jgi:hypothetical protein